MIRICFLYGTLGQVCRTCALKYNLLPIFLCLSAMVIRIHDDRQEGIVRHPKLTWSKHMSRLPFEILNVNYRGQWGPAFLCTVS